MGGSPRILVADDDAWILRMVTTVLEKRGYEVQTATDGEDAFDKAIASPPDLVITDVMMPKMDGWTLVKALRSKPEFAFVPVIFLTALGSDDDRIRGFRLGADDYLPKPFRFEELDLRVAKTLRRVGTTEEETRAHLDGGSRADTAGFAGDLEQIGLSSLLTVMEMERKTGILLLTASDDSEVGRLFLDQGRIVKATLENGIERNEEAVYVLLSWSSGSFEFNRVAVDFDPEIQASTTHLLMEGARRLDELDRAG